MTSLFGSLSFNDLNEVFPNPPIREVAFEIRFAPRLRINADIWQLQDRLVESYPNVSTESITQPTGLININVFQSPDTGRLIKISQQNCVVAFTRYARFEDFKEEVTQRIGMLCETFNITSFTRVGLR